MWIQLDVEVLEKLATLADRAHLSDVASRICRSLAQQRQTPNLLEAYRSEARARFGEEGELKIDDDAVISFGGDAGAYVMAWCWVESPNGKGSEATGFSLGSIGRLMQK